jgi:uncharacterized repeat protein (TIGR01451 family)
MKKIYFILAFSMLSYGVTAQILTKVWEKSLGGTLTDITKGVLTNNDKGFAIIGASASNNGDITGHYGLPDSLDAIIIRTDSLGNKIWSKNYGGTNTDEFSSIAHAPNDGYICVGTTYSNNLDAVTNHGGSDILVVRTDGDGNILWKKCLGGSGSDVGRRVRLLNDGSFLIAGTTTSTNGDVVGNTFGTAAWSIKLDANGSVVWKYCWGNTSWGNTYAAFSADILALPDGNFAIAYRTEAVVSTHPVFGQCASRIGKCVKFNAAGNVIWTYDTYVYNQCGSLREDWYFHSMEQFPNGNIILVGNVVSTSGAVNRKVVNIDYLTGQGISQATSYSSNQYNSKPTNPGYLLVKKDNQFFFSEYDNIVKVLNYTVFFSYGQFGNIPEGYLDEINVNDNVVAYNINGNIGLMKFRDAYNTIQGEAFQDLNHNNAKDAGEPPFTKGWFTTKKTSSIFSNIVQYPNAQGQYTTITDTGTFATSFTPSKPFYTVTPVTKTTVFGNNFYKIDTVNFAVNALPGMRDYSVGVTAGVARPGFTTSYNITVRNNAIDTLTNKPVKMVKDSRLSFVNATPLPSSVVADTITWNITQLLPEQVKTMNIVLQMPLIPTVNLGDTITSKFTIDTTGDINQYDNTAIVKQRVTGSYDPNDKAENHGGSAVKTDLLNGEELFYTIRFQNTGNDTAFKVVVKDTLDAKLDPKTIIMESSSHNYRLEQQYGNILVWTFDNINLVDSGRNEPASNGYISFRIRTKNTIQENDTIKNGSSIYFDFNPPIHTNQVKTIIKGNNPPVTPLVNNVNNSYCNLAGLQKGKLSNPSVDYSITVKLDNQPLIYTAADSSFSFDVTNLTQGNHIINVVYGNASGTQSATKSFNVDRFIQVVIQNPDATVCKLSGNINLASNTAATWVGPGVSGTVFNPATAGVGIHKIIATKTNGSCTDSKDTLNITVDDYIQVVIQNADATVCKLSGNINLASNTTATWVGLGVSGTVFNPATAGVGIHKIIATKTNGSCVDSKDTLNITVDDYIQVVIQNADATVCKLSGNINLAANTAATWVGPGVSGTVFNPATAGVGVHKIIATKTNGSCVDSKDTLNITVKPTVTPDVNINPTATILSSATDKVTLTAINIAGGGLTPLYTFAKDRDFNTILKVESALATVDIAAAILQYGDNWIYVKMKTSDDCFTAQTNIDSVKLQLNITTPTKKDLEKYVKIFPNPSNGKFGFRVETGINDLVKVKIIDMYGKQVLEQNFGLVQQYNFTKQMNISNLGAGNYVLLLQIGANQLQRKLVVIR